MERNGNRIYWYMSALRSTGKKYERAYSTFLPLYDEQWTHIRTQPQNNDRTARNDREKSAATKLKNKKKSEPKSMMNIIRFSQKGNGNTLYCVRVCVCVCAYLCVRVMCMCVTNEADRWCDGRSSDGTSSSCAHQQSILERERYTRWFKRLCETVKK